MTSLSGHHAVITGGGTGIGAAIARALASEGARITLVGRRLGPLEEVAAQIRSSRAKSRDPIERSRDTDANGIQVTSADVTDRSQVDAAFSLAREAQGTITILVNNAGAAAGIPFAKVTPEIWRDMLAVNLDGMFHCCHAALPDLLAAQAGRIVTIASMAGLHGFAYASPYIAAKHGAVGLTRALAAEFAQKRLRVNAVCPGFVDTDMTVQSVSNIAAKTGRSEDSAREELARLNPSGRLISPDEVAAAVLDLVHSDRNGEAVEIA
ncbi:MAG TPA: SDR family NAD(P)-dependent oxidoreductase [Allosphingosinicella sp.]|nr:SDR family NAD(P)-dependent oxidoreductase [Allosphingosinicella sp.]